MWENTQSVGGFPVEATHALRVHGPECPDDQLSSLLQLVGPCLAQHWGTQESQSPAIEQNLWGCPHLTTQCPGHTQGLYPLSHVGAERPDRCTEGQSHTRLYHVPCSLIVHTAIQHHGTPSTEEAQPPTCPWPLTPPCTAPWHRATSQPRRCRVHIPVGRPELEPPSLHEGPRQASDPTFRSPLVPAACSSGLPGTGQNPNSSSSPALPSSQNFFPCQPDCPKIEGNGLKTQASYCSQTCPPEENQ